MQGFLTHKKYDMINIDCVTTLSFGIIFYAAVGGYIHLTAIQSPAPDHNSLMRAADTLNPHHLDSDLHCLMMVKLQKHSDNFEQYIQIVTLK